MPLAICTVPMALFSRTNYPTTAPSNGERHRPLSPRTAAAAQGQRNARKSTALEDFIERRNIISPFRPI